MAHRAGTQPGGWFPVCRRPSSQGTELAGGAGAAPEAERLLRAAGLDPGARGESLSVAEFVRLAAARAAARDFA